MIPFSSGYLVKYKEANLTVELDAAADDCATDKLWMRSPLTPLASNELFARPLIVPHNACHSCCQAGRRTRLWVFKTMRANAGLQLRRAITFNTEGNKTTWETCYRAVSCKALFGGAL